jgi:hypothetical protein
MARRPRFLKNKLSSPRCSGKFVAKETQTCWRCTISGLVWGINWLIVSASSRQDFFLRPNWMSRIDLSVNYEIKPSCRAHCGFAMREFR